MSSEKTGSSLEAMFESTSSESEVERQMMDWAMEESSAQDVVSIAEYPEATPQDVVPLRAVPAEIESSGAPSTSQPTNILSKNPPSKVTGEYLRKMKQLYKFPESLEVRLPLSNERVDFKIPGWIALYERPFHDGLRFPIPTLVREVLKHFEIAPSQLMPNSWRILMSIEVMSFELAIEYGVKDLLYTYFMKEHPVEKGRYLLTLRQKREQLVVGLPTNDRGDWQSYYFLVRGEMVYGSSRADGIPDHWSLSSLRRSGGVESSSRAIANTRSILSIDQADRHWKAVLEEKRLRYSPLWRELLRPEGIPLALTKHLLAVLIGTWSCRVQHGDSLFLKPLTVEQNLCAAEIMSGPFKLPSLGDLMTKAKRRTAKGKEPMNVEEEAPIPLSVEPKKSQSVQIREPAEVVPSRKRRADVEPEDYDNLIVKIPHGTTAISDPSSINCFVDKLLLEEDETRLKELGHVGATNRTVGLLYQALENEIFSRKCAESSQRRMKDLEKTNAALRRETTELKSSSEAAKKDIKSLNSKVASIEASLKLEKSVHNTEKKAYEEAIRSLKKEKEEMEEQMEKIALEAMLKVRRELMEEYVAGKENEWKPKKWIKEHINFEAGLSLDDEEEEEEETMVTAEVGLGVKKAGRVAEAEEAERVEVAEAAEVEVQQIEEVTAADQEQAIQEVPIPMEVPVVESVPTETAEEVPAATDA